MGSSSIETFSEKEASNDSVQQLIRLGRPDFYPCPDCGRKFTERAMQIHKKSCFETDDCVCLVCKTSGTRKEWVEKFGSPNKSIKSKHKFRALIREKSSSPKNGNITESNDNLITFTLLDENCLAIEKIVAESKSLNSCVESLSNLSNENSVLSDHKYVSTASESLENSSPLQEPSPSKSFRGISKFEDHNGEPCNRKLFCSVCNEHVFWDSFGLHVIEHCLILDNKYLKCPSCHKSYSRAALFLIHFYVHVSMHPLDCKDCLCGHPMCVDAGNNAASEHCYAENVPYRCYICLSRFTHGQTIVNHMRLHSKEMPFTCSECNRSFRQIGNLQRHMTTHRGERPHKCPNCCRSFADPATLRNHVRVHTGETPYVCSICNRGFTQVGNLKRHMALHLQKEASSTSMSSTVEVVSDENTVTILNQSDDIRVEMSEGINSEILSLPDSSNKSDAAAEVNGEKAAAYNARKNKKERMKVFTCNICKKVYTWQHDLAIHFRTHTGEKPYKCEICDKRFAQSGAVRIHKLRHHTNSAIGKSRWKNKS